MGVTEVLLSFTLSSIHRLRMLKMCIAYALNWIWTSIVHNLVKHKGTKLEAIQNDAHTLEKIPRHLTVIVNEREEHLNIDNLARLIVWALASGISTVSLYHPNGALNDKVPTLRHHVVRHHEVMFSPPLPQVEVTSYRELSQEKLNNNSYGLCTHHTVLVLSAEDGRQRLSELARELSTAMMSRQLKMEDVDIHLLTNKLAIITDIPDPDLALVCGDTSSSLGYPPWLLRLTEIQNLSNHGKVTYQDFFQSLQRFANCRQRFGK